MPLGFAYFGTHQIPLMEGSSATSRSTSSMAGPRLGPSVTSGTGSISMPKASVMLKWRS